MGFYTEGNHSRQLHRQEVVEIVKTLCRSIPPTPVPEAIATAQEAVLPREVVLREVMLCVRSLMEHLRVDLGNERSAVESENSERSKIGVRNLTAFFVRYVPTGRTKEP